MPSKRQTRRTVSMPGLDYQRLLAHCQAEAERTGEPCAAAAVVTRLVRDLCDARGVPEETILRPTRKKAPRMSLGGVVTFGGPQDKTREPMAFK